MQLPIGPDPKSNNRLEVGGRPAFTYSASTLSVESQLKLRELYEYVEIGRIILGQIQADLSLLKSNPEDSANVQKASERLESFCIEADSWGFNSLYEVGLGIQMLLFNSGSQVRNDTFWDTLNRGLAMLSALLEQCEIDFRWRLAIADVLDSISQISRN